MLGSECGGVVWWHDSIVFWYSQHTLFTLTWYSLVWRTLHTGITFGIWLPSPGRKALDQTEIPRWRSSRHIVMWMFVTISAESQGFNLQRFKKKGWSSQTINSYGGQMTALSMPIFWTRRASHLISSRCSAASNSRSCNFHRPPHSITQINSWWKKHPWLQ